MDKAYNFFGTEENLEEYMDLTKAYFLKRWNSGSEFNKKLCDTICAADFSNLELLYESFPELVDGYCVYHLGVILEIAIASKEKPTGHLHEYTKIQLKKLEREVSEIVGFPITIVEVGEGLITAFWCPGEIGMLFEVNVLRKEELIDFLQKVISRWENAHQEETLEETIDAINGMYNLYNHEICRKYECHNTRTLAFNIGWETGM